MQLFDTILKNEMYVGLSGLNLLKKKDFQLYKGNGSSFLFDMDFSLPFKKSIYLIDQTACRL